MKSFLAISMAVGADAKGRATPIGTVAKGGACMVTMPSYFPQAEINKHSCVTGTTCLVDPTAAQLTAADLDKGVVAKMTCQTRGGLGDWCGDGGTCGPGFRCNRKEVKDLKGTPGNNLCVTEATYNANHIAVGAANGQCNQEAGKVTACTDATGYGCFQAPKGKPGSPPDGTNPVAVTQPWKNTYRCMPAFGELNGACKLPADKMDSIGLIQDDASPTGGCGTALGGRKCIITASPKKAVCKAKNIGILVQNTLQQVNTAYQQAMDEAVRAKLNTAKQQLNPTNGPTFKAAALAGAKKAMEVYNAAMVKQTGDILKAAQSSFAPSDPVFTSAGTVFQDPVSTSQQAQKLGNMAFSDELAAVNTAVNTALTKPADTAMKTLVESVDTAKQALSVDIGEAVTKAAETWKAKQMTSSAKAASLTNMGNWNKLYTYFLQQGYAGAITGVQVGTSAQLAAIQKNTESINAGNNPDPDACVRPINPQRNFQNSYLHQMSPTTPANPQALLTAFNKASNTGTGVKTEGVPAAQLTNAKNIFAKVGPPTTAVLGVQPGANPTIDKGGICQKSVTTLNYPQTTTAAEKAAAAKANTNKYQVVTVFQDKDVSTKAPNGYFMACCVNGASSSRRSRLIRAQISQEASDLRP